MTVDANNLRVWMESFGARIDPRLKVVCDPSVGGGYGIVAGGVVHAGEMVAQIPKHLLFTPAVCRQEVLLGSGNALSVLCEALVRHRALGAASRWHPWISLLPSRFDNLLESTPQAQGTPRDALPPRDGLRPLGLQCDHDSRLLLRFRWRRCLGPHSLYGLLQL